MDPRQQHGLLQAARGLARNGGASTFVVLHDVNLGASWCDCLLLADGRTVAFATPAAVLTPDALQWVYPVGARVLTHSDAPDQPLIVVLPPRS